MTRAAHHARNAPDKIFRLCVIFFRDNVREQDDRRVERAPRAVVARSARHRAGFVSARMRAVRNPTGDRGRAITLVPLRPGEEQPGNNFPDSCLAVLCASGSASAKHGPNAHW
jgi:hypothetical protein